ncbi:MAG: ABC transporter ATP-binding protein [Ilumatobacter sp.]|uniref:ABC transporter ATP-binding protein n=1 Tax=Ilumatobacter sp. TaxID=1967498 RepID=UPI00391DEE7A
MATDSREPPAISISGLRKSYGDREVVRGVSFDVAAGECFGLLGHNGAGKTTTIEILEGYLSRDAGSVSVLGTDPADPSSEWRSRIGIVLQDMDVFPTLTVSETVRMFADLYPRPREVDETIDLVDLGRLASSRVGGLSGGEKRRLDVALGLVGDPELLFLDEPTTGLDPAARRASWTMIEGLKELGVTIVLTTHYMDEAQTLADRLVILDDGVVAAEGTFGELLERHGAATSISFRLSTGAGTGTGTDIEDHVVALAGSIETELRVDGRHAAFSSAHPQRDLHRLLAWADDRRIALDDLTVQRSSLEDLFLSIGSSDDDTRSATAADPGTASEQEAAPQ